MPGRATRHWRESVHSCSPSSWWAVLHSARRVATATDAWLASEIHAVIAAPSALRCSTITPAASVARP